MSNVVAVAGDDTLSTKSYSYPISNVMFESCLLWSEAIGCKIGWSVATPQTGITYSNNVVYNCQNGVGLTEFTGGNSGGSTVGNLTFDTIDVENTSDGIVGRQAWGLFAIQITNGVATNVMVRNITVRQTGLNGSIGGIYANTIINGITFSNILMPGSGVPASNLFQMDIFNQQLYTNLIIQPVQSPLPAVYLTTNDVFGSTSFNAAGNWSNGQQPYPATNYVNATYILRTPTSGSFTFAGGSLTLYDGAQLSLKNDNYTTTVGTNFASGLYLDNSIIKNADIASDTLAGYVTLLPDGGIFQMAAGIGYTFAISAAIGGSGAFQAGAAGEAGLIQLSGANTYTGGTIFGTSFTNSVTLQLAGSGTLGSTNSPLTFNSANDILDLNGTSQGIGNLSGTAGVITNSAASASTLTIGNGDNGGGTFSGNILNGSGTIALTKVGAGTIGLSGINTYSGATVINGGVLSINADGTFGGQPLGAYPVIYSATNVTLNGGELLDTITTSIGANRGLTLGGGGGTLDASSGQTLTVSSIVAGSGGLTKGTNGGAVSLTGTNTFAGNVTVNYGQLWINNSSGLGDLGATKTISVAEYYAELHLNGTNSNITLPSTFNLKTSNNKSPTIANEAGNNTMNGPITLVSGGSGTIINVNGGTLTLAGSISNSASSRQLTLGGAGNGLVNGVITDGAGANTISLLTKAGAGTWTLNATNLYSGSTMISGGTLLVNGVVPTNTVTVAASGTLSGNGLILGATTIQVGGTLSPGNPSGTLTISNSLTLNSGSVSSFGLGTNSDRVAVAGNLVLGGTLNVTNLGSLSTGTNTLFTYTGALSGNLALGTMPAGFKFVLATNVTGKVNLIAVRPVITTTMMLSTNFILTGTGGLATSNYYVLTSTNLVLPLPGWARLVTNLFGSGGSFAFTNGVSSGNPQTFYQIQIP